MTRFERWSVWLASLAVTATGVVYLWMKYFLQGVEPWAVVNHPLQPLVLKLHILTAPLLTFALGLIALRHVWRHFRGRIRWGRRTGLTTVLVVAPMVATGYLIQSITNEGWLKAIALSHIGFGLLYALALALHQVAVTPRRGRRITPGARSRDSSGPARPPAPVPGSARGVSAPTRAAVSPRTPE